MGGGEARGAGPIDEARGAGEVWRGAALCGDGGIWTRCGSARRRGPADVLVSDPRLGRPQVAVDQVRAEERHEDL